MHLDLAHGSLATLPSVLAAGPLAGNWFWTIIIGFFVGIFAKLITPGKDPAGFFITIIIGIAGSLLMLLVGRALFGWYTEGTDQSPGFIASTIGAIILLVIYHLITRRSGPSV